MLVLLFVLLVVMAAVFWMLRSLLFGCDFFVVGGNVEVGCLVGLLVKWLQVVGYVIVALMVGLGGLIFVVCINAGLFLVVGSQELFIFSAVILGGMSLWGGCASVVGLLFGILFINVFYNGLMLE